MMQSKHALKMTSTLCKGLIPLLAVCAAAGCNSGGDAGSVSTTPSAPATPAATAPSTDAGTVTAATCGDIKNLHQVRDLYLASQPSADDLAAAKKLGVKTVINLRPAAETKDFDEASAVRAAGLAYVHIPIAGADNLTDAVFEQTRAALKTAERPLLVHCASANRVGAVWIPYRVLDEKVPLSQAVAEAHTIGLRTPALEAKAKAYVLGKQQ